MPATRTEYTLGSIMKKTVHLALLLMIMPSLAALAQQSRIIDSLERELAATTNSTARVELMLSIATKLPLEDSTRIESYFKKALSLAEQHRSLPLTIIAHANYGRHLYMMYEILAAEQHIARADSLLTDADDETKATYSPAVKSLLAGIYVATGENEKAQKAYQDLVHLWTQRGSLYEASQALRNMGVLFFNQQQYQNALAYYKQSLDTYDVSDPEHRDIGRTLLDIASAYNELDSLEQLRTYLYQANERFAQVQDTLEQMAAYYFLMGEYQRKIGNSGSAVEMYGKSIDIARKFNHVHALTNTLQALADVHSIRGEYAQARVFMEEYLELSYALKDYEFRRVAYKRLAEIEHHLQRYGHSFDYWQRYAAEIDSLNVSDVAKRLHELDQQYQLANREREILDLQLKNERSEWLSQRNLIYVWIAVAIIILTAVISYILYRNVLKQKKIVSQQEALHEFEIAAVKQQHRIDLLSAMMSGEEKERSRIGKDLHDGIGSLLSGVRMSLDSLAQQSAKDSPARQTATHLTKNVDDTIHELRRIAHSMMPDLLEKYGLAEALGNFCKRLTNSRTKINYQTIRVSGKLSPDRQTTLYRIAQELINNAVKHAEATHILVQLQESESRLSLTVEDNGIGFDIERSDNGKSAGLGNIQSRVAYLNGSIDIQSYLSTGTTVTVDCPVLV